MKRFVLLAVIVLSIVFFGIYLWSKNPVITMQNANPLCNEATGRNASFYNFDELVIFYNTILPVLEKTPNFPDAFTSKNFDARLMSHLQRNLEGCLKRGSENKKITILHNPPQRLYTSDDGLLWSVIFNPKSLTIIVNFQFQNVPGGRYAYLEYYLYRPDVIERALRFPNAYTRNDVHFLPTESDEQWVKKLDAFLSKMGPKPVDLIYGITY